MKRHILAILALASAALVITPPVEAQRRGGGNGSSHRSSSTIRPGNSNSRPGNGSSRPGSSNLRPGSGSGHQRPSIGNKPNVDNRPGGNGHNPSIGNGHKPAPGYGHNPGFGHAPTHRPGLAHGYRPGPSRPAYMRPPVRPGRPPIRVWHRPVPPPRWRPTFTGSLLGNILGLTFGVAINSALDNLYNTGYAIDGYMNNEIYLTGVNQFNYYWPDATLFFSGSGLVRSQFFNPTIGFDSARFYELYSYLTRVYGVPASQFMSGSRLSANWFGASGDYISLEYSPISSGNYNYFTILTIGR